MSFTPESISEEDGLGATIGTVKRALDTTGELQVSLASDDETAARVPATVTIPDGQARASFPVDAVDDRDVDGTQMVTVTLNDFTYTRTLGVADDELGGPLDLAAGFNLTGTPMTRGTPASLLACELLSQFDDLRSVGISQFNTGTKRFDTVERDRFNCDDVTGDFPIAVNAGTIITVDRPVTGYIYPCAGSRPCSSERLSLAAGFNLVGGTSLTRGTTAFQLLEALFVQFPNVGSASIARFNASTGRFETAERRIGGVSVGENFLIKVNEGQIISVDKPVTGFVLP